jgi:hypothetical protein
MVDLVGQALVNGAVHVDVDVIPNLVGPQKGIERDVALLPEGAREQIPRPRSNTGRHCVLTSLPWLSLYCLSMLNVTYMYIFYIALPRRTLRLSTRISLLTV